MRHLSGGILLWWVPFDVLVPSPLLSFVRNVLQLDLFSPFFFLFDRSPDACGLRPFFFRLLLFGLFFRQQSIVSTACFFLAF